MVTCDNENIGNKWGLEGRSSSGANPSYRLLQAQAISDEDTMAAQDKKSVKELSAPIDIELEYVSKQELHVPAP
ncbi:hypothetical protein BGX28_004729 [Mortierella sp. GBA30]|nr:hypothetical protein BGX28_004729 [Mortierella sp. GBA30]